jgi:hypothetical protein
MRLRQGYGEFVNNLGYILRPYQEKKNVKAIFHFQIFLLFQPNELSPTKIFTLNSPIKNKVFKKNFFLDCLLTTKPLDRRPTLNSNRLTLDWRDKPYNFHIGMRMRPACSSLSALLKSFLSPREHLLEIKQILGNLDQSWCEQCNCWCGSPQTWVGAGRKREHREQRTAMEVCLPLPVRAMRSRAKL